MKLTQYQYELCTFLNNCVYNELAYPPYLHMTNRIVKATGLRLEIFDLRDGILIVICGTNKTSVRDWITNFKVGLGIVPKQHKQALAIVKDELCKAQVKGKPLICSGHSLGSGIAEYCIANLGNVEYDQYIGIGFNGCGVCIEFSTTNGTFNNSTKVANGTWSSGQGKIHGRSYLEYKPTNPNVTHISMNFNLGFVGVEEEAMVWDASVEPHEPYIPGTQSFKESVILNGDKVFIQFNNGGTSLQSSNLVGAIKELDGKVTNAGAGVVRSVNNQNPNPQGSVTLDGTHISANVGGSNTTVQDHLTNINTTLNSTITTVNNHDRRIARLETKHPTAQVGDIISTFQDSGDKYSVGGVTYLYIGQQRTIQSALYPQLATALGISGATNYQLPVISDVNYTFDHGVRQRKRKCYIVANVDNLHKGV